MAKTAVVRARIDVETKEQAEAILAGYGFTMSHAITMMLRQVVIQGKVPFSLEGVMKLNARSQAVSDAVDRGEIPVTRHESSAAFFESLGISDSPPQK
jgi:DNA-damage-inducible protein J